MNTPNDLNPKVQLVSSKIEQEWWIEGVFGVRLSQERGEKRDVNFCVLSCEWNEACKLHIKSKIYIKQKGLKQSRLYG